LALYRVCQIIFEKWYTKVLSLRSLRPLREIELLDLSPPPLSTKKQKGRGFPPGLFAVEF